MQSKNSAKPVKLSRSVRSVGRRAKHSHGMSLFELLVGLMLGALVVLITLGLYRQAVDKQRLSYQTAGQIDAASQMMDGLAENIRLAGLGQKTGGVLISADQLTGVLSAGRAINPSLLTRSALGLSLVDMKSDQLTIRYTAPMLMWDCEGDIVLGPRQVRLSDSSLLMVDGQVVLERYFAQKETDGSLALRCDAGRYITDDIARDGMRNERSGMVQTAIIDKEVAQGEVSKPFVLKGFGSAGEIVMQDIGGFWVQFLVDDGGGVMPMSITDYQRKYGATVADAPITGLSLSVLSLASPSAVMAQIPSETASASATDSLSVFGRQVAWQRADSPVRGARVYQMDISLPNAKLSQSLVSGINAR